MSKKPALPPQPGDIVRKGEKVTIMLDPVVYNLLLQGQATHVLTQDKFSEGERLKPVTLQEIGSSNKLERKVTFMSTQFHGYLCPGYPQELSAVGTVTRLTVEPVEGE